MRQTLGNVADLIFPISKLGFKYTGEQSSFKWNWNKIIKYISFFFFTELPSLEMNTLLLIESYVKGKHILVQASL